MRCSTGRYTEPKWAPVYDVDPHLPVMLRQLVRLSDGVAAPCPGTVGQPRGMGALELPPEAGAAWSMMNPAWLKRINSGEAERFSSNVHKTDFSTGKIR